jgi:hypothetical protein
MMFKITSTLKENIDEVKINIDKIIETACPVKESRFEFNHEALGGCKPMGKWYVDGGRIRRPGRCWDKFGRAIKVRDITDPTKIRRKFGLPNNPVVKVERDYSKLKRVINMGIFAFEMINPTFREFLKPVKPLIEIL